MTKLAWIRFALASAVALSALASPSDEAPTMKISTEGGQVRLVWEPDLNAKELTKVYQLFGRSELGEGTWESPIRTWHRFFKVEVREPSGEEGEMTSVSGVSFVPQAKPAPGEISGTDDSSFVAETLRPMPYEQAYESGYIQLWANGPYWSSCNLGATNPEESGDYFWWGDTVGYHREDNRWVATTGSETNFQFCGENCLSSPGFSTWAGYELSINQSFDFMQKDGFVTEKTSRVLAATRDVASLRDSATRLPTAEDFAALTNNCTVILTKYHGVWGQRITGKGDFATKSIFLPAAGCGHDLDLVDAGSNGFYWTATTDESLYSSYAYSLRYYASETPRITLRDRFKGFSVRPVRDAAK